MTITRETVEQMIEERLRPWGLRLRSLVVRGVVRVLQESGLQRAQITATADDILEEVECITPPGFTSRPKQAEAVVLAVQGATGHRVALLFDRTTRLQELEDGEAALYVGREGQLVKLLADGGVEVRAAGAAESSIVMKPSGDIVITPGAAAKVLLGGETAVKHVALAEEVDARLAALQLAYDTHTHPTAPVGPVSQPTAVPGVSPVGPLAPTGADNVYGKG
ncbi:phage baseplate assembly protein [Nannocystis pusilla]|uniref:Phage baseplate assembly protein n=1 Tax=Nannocystis pusilla TaxID=889268 RepID=A0A9X3ITH3_9BACT|nr:phage baseplate assembly protein [Nannocystis pusilla]MCY1003987.1 phage baseplate assembly protein [Nannocystis pusilla]MCY1008513.1 phage baseplate assembly protein [Nannocystis pusilla]